jgi:stringent starvation protein B
MKKANRTIGHQRPYLLRAMHEWMVDNGLTPHIVVDATQDGLMIPREHVSDGKLVLNVSYSATRDLSITNELATFEARFDGIAQLLEIPIAAVLGIYARETGQGMVFSDEEPARGPRVTGKKDSGDRDALVPGQITTKRGRPHLRIVK